MPLYLRVARNLQEGISGGLHPVGSLLPTEVELAASFGVSRQTVRQAIQHLRQLRLLSARKGVGTRVEARQPQQAYYHSLQSLTDVFQFARETVFHVVRTERVAARGRLAAELGCRPGRAWIQSQGLREVPGEKVPIGWTDVWIDARYAMAAPGVGVHNTAVFSVIEARYGETIVEVQQTIEATLLSEAHAASLKASAGAPALCITRRYFASGRKLVELSVSLHPADRFRYSMSLRRDTAGS